MASAADHAVSEEQQIAAAVAAAALPAEHVLLGGQGEEHPENSWETWERLCLPKLSRLMVITRRLFLPKIFSLGASQNSRV